MKYLKTYEMIDFEFDRNFEIGETIICIDITNLSYEHVNFLNLYQKYIIIYILPGTDAIQIKDDNNNHDFLGKNRFIHLKDLEKWKLYTNANKYNI